MPLFPTASETASRLLSRLANPLPPQKSHPAAAPINLDNAESSSASRSSSEPSPPTPPVELRRLPKAPSRSSSLSTSNSSDISHRERHKLASQAWREYW
ncbi:hypothetical protein FZEAL_7732 [Fusarium zealandicum]|uniref:Uncharacterized protein n=1 Tax=Fusarium zealandicum TaxID=1053134 RepID=A0A8H4UFA2_9HYPO|nr:hypothetical protein FZEAL_7732 [Fusarium zealandicum]